MKRNHKRKRFLALLLAGIMVAQQSMTGALAEEVAPVNTASQEEVITQLSGTVGDEPEDIARSEAKAKSQSEEESNAQSEAKAKMQSEAESNAQSEAEAKAQSEAESNAQSEAKTQSEAEANAQSEAEAKAQSEAESNAHSEAKGSRKRNQMAGQKKSLQPRLKRSLRILLKQQWLMKRNLREKLFRPKRSRWMIRRRRSFGKRKRKQKTPLLSLAMKVQIRMS